MSRYRLGPTPAQALLGHCRHARFVWNLAVEQQTYWSLRRGTAPGYVEQARQLTEARAAIARIKARQADRRRNWAEQTSTHLARSFEVIGVEDLNICAMTASAKGSLQAPGRNIAAKAGLNRGILASGWGLLVTRLERKAPGRVVKINPAYTSQTCSACGTRDAKARESQAVFACRSCGHAGNADVNAARNIAHQAKLTAAGRAVAARGGPGLPGPANREPQHVLLSA